MDGVEPRHVEIRDFEGKRPIKKAGYGQNPLVPKYEDPKVDSDLFVPDLPAAPAREIFNPDSGKSIPAHPTPRETIENKAATPAALETDKARQPAAPARYNPKIIFSDEKFPTPGETAAKPTPSLSELLKKISSKEDSSAKDTEKTEKPAPTVPDKAGAVSRPLHTKMLHDSYLGGYATPARYSGTWDSYKTDMDAHNNRIRERQANQSRHMSSMGMGFSSLGMGSMFAGPQLPPPPLLPMGEALKHWGNRNREHLGVLLTPPMGNLDPEVKKAQTYVSDMVQTLAGPELKKRGMNVVINVYSGDSLNAFAARHDDKWYGSDIVSEKLAKQNATLATLRPLLDPGNDDKPVYELGISAGTLRKVGSADELAFIMAHELTHLLENHTEPGTRSWLKSQAHEVVADSEGLKMMTVAGYDPAKGIKLLERLHEGHEQPDLEDLFKVASSSAASHHHEGVRVASAQLRTEHLRRTIKDNLPQSESKPLPAHTRLKVAPALGKADTGELQQAVTGLAKEFLAPSVELEAISGLKPKDSKFHGQLYGKWSSEELGAAYEEALKVIDESPGSSQGKVDTALLLLLSVSQQGWRESGPVMVTPTALGKFLTKHREWDPKKFEERLSLKGSGYLGDRNLQQEFVNKVTLNPHFQLSTQRLHSKSKAWQNFYAATPRWSSLGSSSGGTGSPSYMVDTLGKLSGNIGNSYGDSWPKDKPPGKGPMDDVIRGHFVDHLKQDVKEKKWVHAYTLSSARRNMTPEHDFTREVMGVLKPAFQELAANRVQYREKAFEGRDATEKLFESACGTPLDEAEKKELQAKFLRTEDPWIPSGGTREVRDFLGSILSSDEIGRAGKEKAFDAFLRSEVRGLPSESSEGMKEFFGYLESKNPADILEMVKAEAGSRPVGNLRKPPGKDSFGMMSMSHFGGAPEPHEIHRNPLMDAIGKRRALSKKVAADFGLDRLDQILAGSEDRNIPAGARLFMLDALLAANTKNPDPVGFEARLKKITDRSYRLFDGRPELRAEISSVIMPTLQKLPSSELTARLNEDITKDVLSPEHTADLMSQLVKPEKGETPQALSKRVESLEKEFKLEDKPALRKSVQGRIAEQHNIQPQDLKTVFPGDDRTITRQVDSLTGQIRGLSGLVAVTRGKPAEQQIQMVEYMMGRKAEKPEFLEKLDEEVKGKTSDSVSVSMLMEEARASLANADQAVRTAVAASFFAGPTGLLKSDAGREALVEHFVAPVSERRKDMARDLAGVLLDSQGSQDALAVGYLLGLPSKGGEEGLSEGAVLNSLFDAYGTPGIKLKQYLAFTSEFAEFKDHFEESQDNALPLDYLEAVKLARHHYGDKWPSDWKFEEILGSGSVNVAVRVFDRKNNEHRVLSLPRQDVETNSDYDFYRMDKFVDRLLEDPKKKEQFGFLKGLTEVIQDSVNLEFNRKAAFDMQDSVQQLYNRKVGDWNIQTVAAYGIEGRAIEMEEAKGKTARKMLKANPAVYNSAMKAMAQVERDVLFGMDEPGKPKPKGLHANPDFHDGQVLIDEKSKTVTILDFGQAVKISNEQREYGADLLTIIGGAYSAKSAAELLKERAGVDIDPARLQSILDAGKPMDVFTKLLGTMAGEGSKVPLPVVNWVLGVNRQRALADKLGTSLEPSLKVMALVRKTGGDIQAYNALRIAGRAPGQLLNGGILGPIGGWIGQAVTGMLS